MDLFIIGHFHFSFLIYILAISLFSFGRIRSNRSKEVFLQMENDQ